MAASIISIVNQKGGVGKTTTAINLATALSTIDCKILLVDLDPQGNASTGLGIDKNQRELTSYDVILGVCNLKEAILTTKVERVDLIASTVDLSGADVELAQIPGRNQCLLNSIKNSDVLNDYDYILIDCPPSLSLLTINALVASSQLLIPLQCEFFALEGLSLLLNTISHVQKNLNQELEILGVVLTMYDKRNNLSQQVEDDVRNFLGSKVFQTVIPRNIRVSEAPSFGIPVLFYDHKCPGSQAYIRLAKEFLKIV